MRVHGTQHDAASITGRPTAPDNDPHIHTCVQHLVAAYKRERSRWWIYGVQYLLCFAAADGVSVLILHVLGIRSSPASIVAGGFAGGLFAQRGSSLRHGSARSRQLVKEISRCDGAEVIGPLVDALGSDNAETKALARSELCRLFPRLRHSDTVRLTMRQRFTLHRYLRSGARGSPRLEVAILKGLSMVGDVRTLGIARRLARGGRRTPPEVVQAARECLPILEAVASGESSSVLLRAASGSPSVNLLRPAAEQQADAQELLRTGDESH